MSSFRQLFYLNDAPRRQRCTQRSTQSFGGYVACKSDLEAAGSSKAEERFQVDGSCDSEEVPSGRLRAKASSRRHIEAERCLLPGLWLAFLFAGYGLARAGVRFGIPAHGKQDLSPLQLTADWTSLLLHGYVLGNLTNMYSAERFIYVFSRLYFMLGVAAAIPMYGMVSNAPALRHTLVDMADWGATMLLVEAAVVAAALSIIAWHAWMAWRAGMADFWLYLLVRAALIALYMGAGAFLHGKSPRRYATHIHHWQQGFVLASFAEYNHPVSVATLAFGIAVFLQGGGAFTFAGMFEDGAAFVTPHSTGNLTCHFWAAGNYTLAVAPSLAAGLQHQCMAA